MLKFTDCNENIKALNTPNITAVVHHKTETTGDAKWNVQKYCTVKIFNMPFSVQEDTTFRRHIWYNEYGRSYIHIMRFIP